MGGSLKLWKRRTFGKFTDDVQTLIGDRYTYAFAREILRGRNVGFAPNPSNPMESEMLPIDSVFRTVHIATRKAPMKRDH
jgi:hypothetical protein